MGETYWLLGLVFVLIADLAIGVLVGWLWCSAAGDRRDSDALERLFRRNDELFRVIYTVLRQSREYTGRLGQMRVHLQQLPASTTTRIVAGLIDSMDQLNGELTTTHDRLQRHLDFSQEATATARRDYQPNSPSTSSAVASQVTSAPSVSTNQAAPETAAETGPDARQEERQPYRHQQSAAPYMQGQIPKPDMFQAVQCCDLSSGGVSYLTPDRPKSDMVVITIGDERNLVYKTARVVQVAEVQGEEEFGRMFRVGCQFTGRLHRHLFA